MFYIADLKQYHFVVKLIFKVGKVIIEFVFGKVFWFLYAVVK